MNKYVYVVSRRFGQKSIVAVFDSEEESLGFVKEYENKKIEQGKPFKPLFINRMVMNKRPLL